VKSVVVRLLAKITVEVVVIQKPDIVFAVMGKSTSLGQ